MWVRGVGVGDMPGCTCGLECGGSHALWPVTVHMYRFPVLLHASSAFKSLLSLAALQAHIARRSVFGELAQERGCAGTWEDMHASASMCSCGGNACH
eukprot:1140553-Pelagomonas_calceolata.AAC.6